MSDDHLYELLRPWLRRQPCHVTSIDGYRSIRRSGFILPNDGRFPFSFPQSDVSFGRARGFVSLFDLQTPSNVEVESEWVKCAGFFVWHRPATIVLMLDRGGIAAQLIGNGARNAEASTEVYIPHVEVWSREPIPFSSVMECLLVRTTGGVTDPASLFAGEPLEPRRVTVEGFPSTSEGLEGLERRIRSLA